jgi:hypothetical protein
MVRLRLLPQREVVALRQLGYNTTATRSSCTAGTNHGKAMEPLHHTMCQVTGHSWLLAKR